MSRLCHEGPLSIARLSEGADITRQAITKHLGTLETSGLLEAKRQGKTRFVGFTGHKDPSIHLAMLNTGFAFDSVQMPLNSFDHSFHSFETNVLPELQRRGIAPIGMKPFSGRGDAVKKGVLSAEEALRYAMSLPVATTVTGMERMGILEQNLKIAQGFQPLSQSSLSSLRDRVRQYAADGRFELYKGSLRFDNPEARLAHDFPLDPVQAEVKEIMKSAENTGKPFPEAK